MAKTLDFNLVAPPTLPLVMRDDNHTQITITYPNEGMIEELMAVAPRMQEMLQEDEDLATPVVYDLAARLMKHNKEGLQVTVDDLRGKYRMNLELLLVFFNAYLDFLGELNNAKN